MGIKIFCRSVLLPLAIFLSCSVSMIAQVPPKPAVANAVNDYAGLFSSSQRSKVESALVEFARKTSNRIVVVTVDDLGGMPASEFAFELGESWGVGSDKFDNGVVFLIKPKTRDSKGEVFIAVGYGLEGAIPDAVAKRIIETKVLPRFRQNDYYGGLVDALNVIMPLAAGEITSEEVMDDGGGAAMVISVLVLLGLILLIGGIFRGGGKNMGGHNHRGPDVLDMIFLGSMLGGSGRSSGGSGGFGGFGGGSFGGGGAGGSW